MTQLLTMIVRFFHIKIFYQKSVLRTLERIDAFRKSGDNSFCKLTGSKQLACLEYNSNSSEFLVLNTKQMFSGNWSNKSVISVFTLFSDSIVSYFTKVDHRCFENVPKIKCDVE